MSEQQTLIDEMEQEPEEEEEGEAEDNHNKTNTCAAAASRKERRKAAKKEKRKKKRKEMADMARREEEARLNDPEEQLRLQAEEEQEKMRVEKERREFEERERKILEEWERRRAQEQMEEEERRRRAQEEEHQSKQNQVGYESEVDEDGWEYVEEGPPEIIWQGNEIIVKKKKVRVKKQEAGEQIAKEDPNRPTSNPLPPQSEAFADYKNTPSLSAQQLLQSVAQETPNFGTEQDKAHCPFHLKTGACRFGSRCSRIHFYPDKSCTLLIKNMYGGPGLAWEQDEGLEYTDEEVERAYEEFYEDVHTEFLKFGEIVNFKVCRNGSSHLRGNVYVHYKSLDSAVLAYQSANGRYFAGKQIQCEFIGVTRWKVAICGEFMKTKLQTCSRGTACNFIHCFRNPGGDYEWADWDKPPPRYWLKKMTALFGFTDDSGYDKHIERGSPRSFRNSSRISSDDADRYHSRRSQSRDIDYARSSRNYSEDHVRSNSHGRRSKIADRKHPEDPDDKQYNDTSNFREKPHRNDVSFDSDSDRKCLDKNMDRHSSSNRSQTHRKRKLDTRGGKNNENDPDESKYNSDRDKKLAGSTYERHLIGDWSDGERDSDHIHTEKSTKSNCSEEFEDRKSKRHSARKRKDSRTRSHMGKENETAGDDSGDHSSYGRSYRYSDSGSGYYSAKDSRKLEMDESEKQLPGHFKKSKGKRESNKKSDSESRIQHHEEKISRAADCRIVEVTEGRDRWEPEKGDSAEFD